MAATPSIGASPIALVVKLPEGAEAPSLAEIVLTVARRLADDQIRATWVTSAPSLGPALQRGLQIAAGSEIAIQASLGAPKDGIAFDREATWQASELATTQLRASGLPATTLWTASLDAITGRTAALAQLGFRAVLTPATEISDRFAPRQLSHGLWQFGIAAEFPLRSFWQPPVSGTIGRIMRQGAKGLVVISIDVARIAASPARGLRRMERIVDVLAWGQSTGSIEIVTVAEAVRNLASRTTSQPQRSILRVA